MEPLLHTEGNTKGKTQNQQQVFETPCHQDGVFVTSSYDPSSHFEDIGVRFSEYGPWRDPLLRSSEVCVECLGPRRTPPRKCWPCRAPEYSGGFGSRNFFLVFRWSWLGDGGVAKDKKANTITRITMMRPGLLDQLLLHPHNDEEEEKDDFYYGERLGIAITCYHVYVQGSCNCQQF